MKTGPTNTRTFKTFSLLSLLVAITAAAAALAYVHARIYERQPHAFRVHDTIPGVPTAPFREALADKILKLGHEQSNAPEGNALAMLPLVHHDCPGTAEIYQGRFPNGKIYFIHCYYCPNPVQPENDLYSISVCFFETPYERWNTERANHIHARDTALGQKNLAQSLWREQWHAHQRKRKGLPPIDVSDAANEYD